MLRMRVFPIAAAIAALSVLGGCVTTVRDARFRSIELAPVSQTEAETVADLQVVSEKKVIGVARGVVTSPEQKQNLYVEALELAIASDPSDADVLVAPSYFEVIEDNVNVTVTVMGYPARYTNFRLDAKQPFSTRQLPGGATVVSYDKNAFTAKMLSGGVVAIQAVKSGVPADGETGKADAPPVSTSARTGE